MDVIGIITEYNPFHNGHIWHLKKIKEMYPNSLVILVLNGYFLERGEVSCLTKEDKVRVSLDYGIDLVLELPVFFGTQAADVFAEKAIEILNYFKVEKIVFGSELNDILVLEQIVAKIMDESYQDKVKELLDKGLNYPTALARATNVDIDFNKPNDLLAISYLKAIKLNNYKIDAIPIKRTSDYHDIESMEEIVSASNIRYKLQNKEDITNYLPKYVIDKIHLHKQELFFDLIRSKILTTPNLEQFLTVDEGIEKRLYEKVKNCHSLDEFIEKVKTKRYTYNKIRRMLVHIMLGITKKDNEKIWLTYVKILGFNEIGQKYLQKVKKNLEIATVVDKSSLVYKTEIVASIIYDMLNNTNTYLFEIKNTPIRK